VEFLSTKVGLVLVVLGAMHFFNMFNFDKMRRKARTRRVDTADEVEMRDNVDALAGRL
jgi:hypothetical protein